MSEFNNIFFSPLHLYMLSMVLSFSFPLIVIIYLFSWLYVSLLNLHIYFCPFL